MAILTEKGITEDDAVAGWDQVRMLTPVYQKNVLLRVYYRTNQSRGVLTPDRVMIDLDFAALLVGQKKVRRIDKDERLWIDQLLLVVAAVLIWGFKSIEWLFMLSLMLLAVRRRPFREYITLDITILVLLVASGIGLLIILLG